MENGGRSPATKIDRTELANNLVGFLEEAPHDKFMILVIMDDAKGELDFSQAPFMTAQTFIKEFANITRETSNG